MKKINNIKIFIAGHNGMVGSALCKFLNERNFKNIITIERKKLDLKNFENIEKFIKKNRPSVVINCAGKVGGILANSSYSTEFLNENILIQLNLIKASYKSKIKHFINLGSSCIYPKNAKQPIKEEYLLSGYLEKTNEAYALAKIIGLKSCEFYNSQFNTSYFTLMPCNLYGPGDNFSDRDSHFIPALIKKCVEANKNNKKTIEVWGSGKVKREIMHVDDLASAIHFVMLKKISGDQKFKNILKKNCFINVGSGQEETVKKFAIIISKLVSTKLNLRFNKMYPNGTKRKFLDNSIMKKLGWQPKISLVKGLSEVIDWYQKHY